ncbi:SDR family oxidoreductase [Parerythrobacter jejuensis]|uniref:Sugar nucleotide-binding protein n=1 Tax=Parerythrobacter jejuensis TaxID=795812 RepID=A0A845ARC8_9SPHN|nr:SDR family oxidoreductase [Parerythrobacter jejuensis]MXP31445.1 sugar nucleotide-binding protein [Parerythrobacter jejuensis]
MRILVTGAAGLIGGELCARLTASGHQVAGLVRSNPDVLANDGTRAEIEEVLHGDLSQEGMGLEAGVLDRLSGDLDLVLHCAALTRFDLEEEAYRATNVDGTARALELARRAGANFLHISTAYVCGGRSGDILESDALPSGGFTNVYEASKAEAEALVRASGVPFAIARPSIVVGDSRTGAIRQFDTIYAAFKLIAEGRVRHMPVRDGATLDFVPLDHVARGIVALTENFEQASGGAYHLVSGGPVPVSDFAAAIGSFAEFDAPALVAAEGFDPSTLPAMERRLFRRVAGLYANYFQRDPQFDDTQLRAATGLVPPAMDQALLRKLIQYCLDVGFLKAREPQRISG